MLPQSLQTSYTLGELSPTLQGFTSLPDYARGLLVAENFLVGSTGGMLFRPGTYYAADTRLDAQAKLIEFVYNSGESYVLEFTQAGTIRFYTNDGSLDVAYTVTNATFTTGTATITFNADHCFLVGDTITVAGIVATGGTDSYNGTFVLTGVGTTTISFALAATGGTYSSGGTATGQYQITNSPYTANFPNSWTQSNDVLYLADGVNPIQQLVRTGTIAWTISALQAYAGPFLNTNTSAVTMTPSAGGTHIAASSATFVSTDVGRLLMVLDTGTQYNGTTGGSWVWGIIGTYTDSTHVIVPQWYQTVSAVNIAVTMVGTTATTQWALGAWGATEGYPSVLAIHQQRLITGGETQDPQMLRGSVTGSYAQFTPFDPDGTVNPDNAYAFEVASGNADAIKWLATGQDHLVLGTGECEYMVTSQGPAISPTDVDVVMQTTIGTDGSIQPVQLNYRILMMQRGNLNLIEWAFAYFVQGYMGTWVNQMSKHITYPGIVRMAATMTPTLRLYLLRSDGQLVVCTDSHEAKQGLAASPGGTLGFTRIVPGGSFNGGPAVIEDFAIIPTAGYDQVWLVVKRTVNSQTVRHVEFFTGDFDTDPAATMANAFQVDCGLAFSAGSPTSTISGLSQLEGESVVGWDATNDLPFGPLTVSGGTITLTTATQAAVVGLSYSGACETMQLNIAQVQGKLQYAVRAYLRLYQTFGGYFLTGPEYMTQLPIAESAGTLYTGSCRAVLDQGSGTEQHIAWGQVSPYPMAVLSSSIDFNVGSS